MAGTLFFVHGTGVRQAGYERTWAALQDGARQKQIPATAFVGCPWGPTLGVPVERIADTLPDQVATRDAFGAGAPPSDQELQSAEWALLLEDPLFELRLVAGGAAAGVDDGVVVVAEARADQTAIAIVRSLASRPVDLDGTGVEREELEQAAEAVASAPELAGAALAAPDPTDADLVRAIARAVVATMLQPHLLDPPGAAPAALLDGAKRNRLVDEIADTLVPVETRGAMTDWIKNRVVGFAERKATALAVTRREGLMTSSLPGIGDILFYQRRGEAIIQMVTDALAGLEQPVVAVGHSLGGIVLVDLLTRASAPRVDLLVTAGSQSPLFYAIDALANLRRDQPLPAPPTPWLNIYNPQDLLSFCAARVFPDVPGIEDCEVDPGVPFPPAHSAYWHDGTVFELIRDRWPGA
jgi:hypothetical protein